MPVLKVMSVGINIKSIFVSSNKTLRDGRSPSCIKGERRRLLAHINLAYINYCKSPKHFHILYI